MKKLLGILFRIIAGFLAVSVLFQLPKLLEIILHPPGDSEQYNTGYIIGQLIAFLLMGGIAFFLWSYGGKKLRESANE